MKNLTIGWSTVLLCATLAAPAFAADTNSDMNAVSEMPAAAAGINMTSTATVEAIDQKNRVVTLRSEEGEVFRQAVGDEVRNLAQVKVGDKVTITYQIGLAVALSHAADAGSLRKRIETDTLTRNDLGQKPGATLRKTVEAEGVVEAIDTKARTVTLKGAEQTLKLEIDKAVDMSNIKVGDKVFAVYQESLAISVKPAY